MRQYFFYLHILLALPAKWTLAFPLGESQTEEVDSEIFGTASHIVILQADLEHIAGAYYLGVNNRGLTPRAWQLRLRLPAEVDNFSPGSNVKADELGLDQDGSLVITKKFPPGMTLVSVLFQLPVDRGQTTAFTLKPTSAIEGLYFVSAQSQLHLSGADFSTAIPPMLAGGDYKGIAKFKVDAGELLHIEVSGIPQGRLSLIVTGILTAIILAIAMLWIASRREFHRHGGHLPSAS